MKKIAFVAAIAASIAAPAAFAQSTVTLWGRINTSVESVKIGNGDRIVREENNSSRFGLKGNEDLGGGLSASFHLESGLNSATGAASGGTTFWNRESSVQLNGDFGSVKLGSWFPDSYFATIDRTSNHNHDTGTSQDQLYSAIGFISGNNTNKVGYFTPNISGFVGALSVHAGEGSLTSSRSYDLSANYQLDSLHIGFGYSEADKTGNGLIPRLSNAIIETDYAFGPFLVTGYYEQAQTDGYKSRNVGRLSAMYTMGASEFQINVGGTKAGGNGYDSNGSDISGGNNFRFAGASQFTLAYNYNLSKRTKLYAFYTEINQKSNPLALNNAGDFNSIAGGIRHNF